MSEANLCGCIPPSDVFNGVCGNCLLPVNDNPRDSRGELLEDKDFVRHMDDDLYSDDDFI